MAIGKIHSIKKVTAQLLLLALPTAALLFYLLWRVNQFYSILENHWIRQGVYFFTGSALALIFYAYRFRFMATAGALFLLQYVIYKSLGSINVSEFDAFYFSIQFLIFSILFYCGWLVGFGFSRSRYFTVFWAVLLLVIQIVVVSKTEDIKASALINAFVPVLTYAFYIIYTAELIRNMNEEEVHFGWFIFKRLSGFALFLVILFLVLLSIFKNDFQSVEKEWGGSSSKAEQGKGTDKSESMTKKDKNGGVSNKDQTKLSGSLNKDKELVFVARLDNFFSDGKTPNPLYFTGFYYTKFDTATQTFEIDPNIPYNDLFEPDPSAIPLYFKKTDPTVIKNSLATRNRKIINAEVYNVSLSSKEYLAPSTSFFCQPISVPGELKQKYRSAYVAKMWVSDLNSAYFIYNPAGNKMLENFQAQRFELLREVKEIKGPDAAFMKYYTYMPRDKEYAKISELSEKITKNARTPIDKIIAIRDYFLSKDELGQPLFKYSDNPGIPGLPSANKLTYFLFENRKGYCAYFAGATLFMLRALGIPSRVAVGFSTTDRSTKNPGWYWFYRDQAHAWVQVYFNEFGWIDFDTTVPDVNTQQAPQPDGTPPDNVLQTYLVADGEVEDLDLKTKRLTMRVEKLLYHDTDYATKPAKIMIADVSLASVMCDTGAVTLNMITRGMHVTAVSHAEVLKNIHAGKNDSVAGIVRKIPKPVPVDELKIVIKDNLQKQHEKEKTRTKEDIDWVRVLWVILGSIVSLLILLFLVPAFTWQYLHAKAKKEKENSAYYRYRASLYYLNQLGYGIQHASPKEYALYIDVQFETNFVSFNDLYQKLKYSTTPLTAGEEQDLHEFYKPFIRNIKRRVPFKMRCTRFLNIISTLHYFSKPKLS
jgi:transglutaminase-like putative cysteine protease